MIGNVIQKQFLVVKDYPTAEALSMVLMVIILIGVLLYTRALGTENWYDHPGDGRGDQSRAGENNQGPPEVGDWLLRIVAGLVLLYLFLPIFMIILFSFNDPKGKFNYSWQGFTLKNWADPFKYPR